MASYFPVIFEDDPGEDFMIHWMVDFMRTGVTVTSFADIAFIPAPGQSGYSINIYRIILW